MIHPKRFREFLVECRTSISDIKRVELLVDDDDINQITKEHSVDDNYLLLGILPEYDTGGSADGDSIADNSHLGLMVLSKVNYRKFTTYSEYTDVFLDTFDVMLKLRDFVLESVRGENEFCDIFQHVDPASLSIEPIKRQDQCNGWILVFSIYE